MSNFSSTYTKKYKNKKKSIKFQRDSFFNLEMFSKMYLTIHVSEMTAFKNTVSIFNY